ncbi:MAG: serine O-acetyltransferase [Lysobacterales bacterium]
MSIVDDVEEAIRKIVSSFIPEPLHLGISGEELNGIMLETHQQALLDLEDYVRRDAAARSDGAYVFDSYLSYAAVLNYRVATALHYLMPGNGTLAKVARRISEAAKISTGVEIHPAAKIGIPFVIDHGWNTVIGETAIVGNNCYFLQSILLGGRAVNNSRSGKRHPHVGDNVQIAGNVQLIGNIRIGSNVTIEPGAKITWDVPDNSQVKVICACQVTRTAGQYAAESPRVDAVIFNQQEQTLEVYGDQIVTSLAYICMIPAQEENPDGGAQLGYIRIGEALRVNKAAAHFVSYHLPDNGWKSNNKPILNSRYSYCIEIAPEGAQSSASVYVINTPALRTIVREILR